VADRYEDERGVIQDLLVGSFDAVTEIFTKRGAVRGNHYHELTTQWTYIVSGKLLILTQTPEEKKQGAISQHIYWPREMACEAPGVVHTWQALEDTTVLVFTRGPRSGEAYESDTYRVGGKDRLIVP
jgi:dTDP-4-dehydrorhamnose 3,5-epimerase-like enzyme